MRLDSDFWLHNYTFKGRLVGFDVYVFNWNTLAARLVHVVESRDRELLGTQAAVTDVAVTVTCI